MRLLLYAFWALFAGVLLLGLIMNVVSRIAKKNTPQKPNKPQIKPGSSKRMSNGLLIILLPLIFGGCCAQNTPLQIDAPCEPIYGRATDWGVISDDLARNIYRHNLTCEKLKDEK